MSLAENHVATTYPLGGSSRRRRMLAIRFASQNLPAPPRLDTPAIATRLNPDTTDSLNHLRTSASPVTWLFVGDSFLPAETRSRDWPGFVELFTAGLRNRPSKDPVVDVCTPEFRACDVLHGFNERIRERNPSVVFLLCGAADSDAGLSALAEFENTLLSVARRLEDADILLVLNTPPVPFYEADHPSAAAHLVHAEAVRAIAAEFDLPLIDHRRDWEQFAIPPGLYGSWYDNDGRYPSALGHRQIALKLLSVLAEPQRRHTDNLMSLVARSE